MSNEQAVAERQSARDQSSAALAGDLRVLIGRLARRLREEAHLGDFTWSQIKVITRLDRDGPATVSALAHAEGIRPQSMSVTVTGLKAAGLIEGAPDPTDRRQTVLSLTPACRAALKDTRAAKEDWLARALGSRLSVDERKTLGAAVGLLGRLADP